MSKIRRSAHIWTQREDGTGWWTAYGRVGKIHEPWFRVDPSSASAILSFFGVAGVMVDWNIGIYVSVGASRIGYAGLGYVPRRRYYSGGGPTSKDWARHDELRSKVIT